MDYLKVNSIIQTEVGKIDLTYPREVIIDSLFDKDQWTLFLLLKDNSPEGSIVLDPFGYQDINLVTFCESDLLDKQVNDLADLIVVSDNWGGNHPSCDDVEKSQSYGAPSIE